VQYELLKMLPFIVFILHALFGATYRGGHKQQMYTFTLLSPLPTATGKPPTQAARPTHAHGCKAHGCTWLQGTWLQGRRMHMASQVPQLGSTFSQAFSWG